MGTYWTEQIDSEVNSIGLDITSFDSNVMLTIAGEFEEDAKDTAVEIFAQHDHESKTFKLAERFGKKEINANEFKDALLLCYLNMYRNHYDYITSDKGIAETLTLNQWDFTAQGELVDEIKVDEMKYKS